MALSRPTRRRHRLVAASVPLTGASSQPTAPSAPRRAHLHSFGSRIKDGKHEKLQVVPDSSVKKIGVKRASDPSLFAKSADTGAEAVGK